MIELDCRDVPVTRPDVTGRDPMDVFTSRSCHAFGSCDSCASRRLASARVERCSLLSSYHRHISSLRRATTSIRRPHSLHRSSPLRRREWARADKGGTAALCPAPRRDGCLCALSSGPVCRKTCWIGVPLRRLSAASTALPSRPSSAPDREKSRTEERPCPRPITSPS